EGRRRGRARRRPDPRGVALPAATLRARDARGSDQGVGVARIKLVYLGGGSTRAAGTMASFMHNGADFDGSEVVLVDLDASRLDLIRTLAEKWAKARG